MHDRLPGFYYREQLTKAPDVNYKTQFFEVEKILKTKKIKNKTFYYVKYMWYPKKFNQWIPATNLKS